MASSDKSIRKGVEGAWDVLSKAVILRSEEYFLHAWTACYIEFYGDPQGESYDGTISELAYGLLALTNMRLLFVAPRSEERWDGFNQLPPLDPRFIKASSGCHFASAKERNCVWKSWDLEDVESFKLRRRRLSPNTTLFVRWWHRGHPHTSQLTNLSPLSSYNEDYVWTIGTVRVEGAEPVDRVALRSILMEALQDRWVEAAEAMSTIKGPIVVDFSTLRERLNKEGISLKSIKCPSCGGIVSLPIAGAKKTCEYCGSHIYAMQVMSRAK